MQRKQSACTRAKKAQSSSLANIKWKTLFAPLLAISLAATAHAQDTTTAIDKIFDWATPATPGCVCAVSQNGKMVVNRAYGAADLERRTPLTTASVFDAGSVVKQFVAASVLLLVEEGKLSLAEDIHKYIPELPDYGHKITLDHLLTHTSGIRDWTGIRPLAEGDPDALTLTLRQRGLNFIPGTEWSYSNSGYVLLKEIVARTSGMSFAHFTRKRLFEPLDMKTTTYEPDMDALVPNRALAYRKEAGGWKMDMHEGNERGGGGALFSTPADLLRWNDALANRRLGDFVTAKLHEPATLSNGRKLGYGRGLVLDSFRRGGQLVWHSGGAAGYGTILARLPEQGLSVAIMCNADGTARSAYAGRLFDLFLPPVAEVKEETTPAPNTAGSIAGGDLQAKAGLFFNEQTGQFLRLGMNNKMLSIAGGGPLLPLAADRFRNQEPSTQFLSEAAFELQFLSADRFEIRTKEGETSGYERVTDYTPSAAELAALAGQYESNEMGSVLEMVPAKNGLTMRFYRNHGKAVPLKPFGRDRFMAGMMSVRFLRDKEGKITGFSYSNPVVRNIRFSRLPEAKGRQ